MTVTLKIYGYVTNAGLTSVVSCGLRVSGAWEDAGSIIITDVLSWQSRDVTSLLNTTTKINNARLRLTLNTNGARQIYIYKACLDVDGQLLYVNLYYQDYKDADITLTGDSPYLQNTLTDYISATQASKTIMWFTFGTTYAGGPFLSLGTIETYAVSGSPVTIGPISLPFARMNENLQTVIERTVDPLTDVPWEWWIDYAGAINVADVRGSTKAITLLAGTHIGGSIREASTKQTAQRVRVIGQGESAQQDLNTSEWKENSTDMTTINTFYENIVTDKTILNKSVADTWADIILAMMSGIREEVTVYLTNDPYTANDFDVGDTVTVTDPATGLSGLYRIKTIDKTVTGAPEGENTTITCSLCRTDITDRLADIFRKVQGLMNSSTFLDQMFGEGGNQTKVASEDVTDVWEQTSSNKYYSNFPDKEDETSVDKVMGYCVCPGRGAIGYTCDSEEFEIHGSALDCMGYVFLTDPLLKFSRNPRFNCEFEIDTDVGDPWAADDLVWMLILELGTYPANVCTVPFGTVAFGFQVRYDGTFYILKAIVTDRVNPPTSIEIARINTDIKYTIEARMEWEEKVIKFYFGKTDVDTTDSDYILWQFRLRGILPIAYGAADEDELCPFSVMLDAESGTTKPQVVIYRWKTQAIKGI